MLEEFAALFQAPLGGWEALVRIGFSVIASVVAYYMYYFFYGSRHIGAGVNRTFLIGGPAITMLFLVIQTSIPLGVGLLGALSFVRFRTPIKDPAEIGFLLLLISASIGAATGNLLAVIILYLAVFLILWIQRLFHDRGSLSGMGHLMISVDQQAFPEMEQELKSLLEKRLSGLRLDTMSTIEGRVSLHYEYKRQQEFNWSTFNKELNKLAGKSRVDTFIS